MLALLLVACATGLGCGLARLKVWALIPASNVFGVIAVVLGSYLGHTVGGSCLDRVSRPYVVAGRIFDWNSCFGYSDTP